MSETTSSANNVLPFKRPAKRTKLALQAVAELRELLMVYDQLIGLLRETYDEGLDTLTDGLVKSVVDCRAALAGQLDDQTGQLLLQAMRTELREMPQTLRSLLPGIGPRLGESMERKLGIQFKNY